MGNKGHLSNPYYRFISRTGTLIFLIALLLPFGCSRNQDTEDIFSIPEPLTPKIASETVDILLRKGFNNGQTKYFLQAQTILEAAIKEYPKDIDLRLHLIDLLLYNDASLTDEKSLAERTRQAKARIDRLLAIDPENARAYLRMAHIHFGDFRPGMKKNIKKAIANFNLAEKYAPESDSDFYRQLGNLALDLNLKDRAEQIFLRSIKIAKQKNQPFKRQQSQQALGNLYISQGRLDLAERFLVNATKNDEDAGWGCAYQALGVLYKKMGYVNKSLKNFKKAADLNKDNATDSYIAAVMCFYSSDFECTEKYADMAISINDRGYYHAVKGYALLFSREYEKAMEIFKTNSEPGIEGLGSKAGIGHYLIIQKQYAKALEVLTKVKTELEQGYDSNIHPECVNLTSYMADIGLGWVYANRNNHQKAIEFFNFILRKNEFDVLALLGKANSLVFTGKSDRAEKIYNKVLKISPDNPHALAELAGIHLQRGNDDKAERLYNKAISFGGDDFTCPFEGLGLLYLKKGQTGHAKMNFQKAIDINSEIEFKKFNGLAKIYIQEGKLEKAEKLLEKSKENYPFDNEADMLLGKIEKIKSSSVRPKEPTDSASSN